MGSGSGVRITLITTWRVTQIDSTAPSLPVSFKSITDLVGERIAALITEYNITSLIGNSNALPYIATVVRQGSFQDNPVQKRISILIYPQDPDDMRNEPRQSDSTGKKDEVLELVNAELGGGGMEWIRFTIDIKCYFSLSAESRDTARHIATWVFGRAKQAIRENRGLNLVDDFGERALQMEVTKKNLIEGGGPGAFNWNGQIWVSVAIESPSTI